MPIIVPGGLGAAARGGSGAAGMAIAGPPIIVCCPRCGAGAGATTGGGAASGVDAKPSIVRCAGRSAGSGAAFAEVIAPPHWLQKVAPSGIEEPHWEQVWGIGPRR